MKTQALLAAALLALVLCGCSGGKSEELNNRLAKMESELAGAKTELAEVKVMAGNLKSELAAVKGEVQTLVQKELKEEAATAAESVAAEAPAPPEPPAGSGK